MGFDSIKARNLEITGLCYDASTCSPRRFLRDDTREWAEDQFVCHAGTGKE